MRLAHDSTGRFVLCRRRLVGMMDESASSIGGSSQSGSVPEEVSRSLDSLASYGQFSNRGALYLSVSVR